MKLDDAANELLAPLLEEQRRKQRAANEKRHRAISQERHELEQENAARTPVLARTLETEGANLARVIAERDAAQVRRDAAFNALAGWSYEYQRRRTIAEAEQRETANPAIAAAKAEVDAAIELTRRRSGETVEVIDLDRSFDRKTTTIYTISAQIRRRLEALRTIREELTKLELEVDIDVPVRIAELWATIPEIGRTEAFVQQKPEFVK